MLPQYSPTEGVKRLDLCGSQCSFAPVKMVAHLCFSDSVIAVRYAPESSTYRNVGRIQASVQELSRGRFFLALSSLTHLHFLQQLSFNWTAVPIPHSTTGVVISRNGSVGLDTWPTLEKWSVTFQSPHSRESFCRIISEGGCELHQRSETNLELERDEEEASSVSELDDGGWTIPAAVQEKTGKGRLASSPHINDALRGHSRREKPGEPEAIWWKRHVVPYTTAAVPSFSAEARMHGRVSYGKPECGREDAMPKQRILGQSQEKFGGLLICRNKVKGRQQLPLRQWEARQGGNFLSLVDERDSVGSIAAVRRLHNGSTKRDQIVATRPGLESPDLLVIEIRWCRPPLHRLRVRSEMETNHSETSAIIRRLTIHLRPGIVIEPAECEKVGIFREVRNFVNCFIGAFAYLDSLMKQRNAALATSPVQNSTWIVPEGSARPELEAGLQTAGLRERLAGICDRDMLVVTRNRYMGFVIDGIPARRRQVAIKDRHLPERREGSWATQNIIASERSQKSWIMGFVSNGGGINSDDVGYHCLTEQTCWIQLAS
ncbi:hypothetical protein CONPUDRAFT_75583 [Coniophora puteana RWD-64-598 SS2]|uniref:Uncharacterized protein n=1 Tax=Coniophora puteana (strain RWD-64-598) TaxID=741705 RepID=A0A5M3MEY0_CONPW|nr:uncharacterized protein CONPUDRAFT_75583 [Coniophora puteana RWD-64-598 SS2]EIW77788.1 hypothetical protein CONPUDRAFT_75583 [Coniophora puteana RWD-64-598 SS2]